MAEFSAVQTVEIPLGRYDELIRAEYKLNMLQNTLEDMHGYTSIDELKKHFGIYKGDINE